MNTQQRIADLEAQLALALRQRDCESERSGKRMDEIVELREQLSAAKNPRVMKRWGVDGVPAPGEMCWLLVVGIMHRESLSDNEIRQRRIAGCTIPGKITHWLESEPAPTLPETSRDIIAGNGD